MIHLQSIIAKQANRQDKTFPFNLAVVNSLEKIEFSSPVTFFVGENGSGKSTLLKAIACAVGSITVGSESVKTDQTLGSARRLAQQLRLSWRKRTHRGFFLRAEDFFGYAKRLAQVKAEMQAELKNIDQE